MPQHAYLCLPLAWSGGLVMLEATDVPMECALCRQYAALMIKNAEAASAVVSQDRF